MTQTAVQAIQAFRCHSLLMALEHHATPDCMCGCQETCSTTQHLMGSDCSALNTACRQVLPGMQSRTSSATFMSAHVHRTTAGRCSYQSNYVFKCGRAAVLSSCEQPVTCSSRLDVNPVLDALQPYPGLEHCHWKGAWMAYAWQVVTSKSGNAAIAVSAHDLNAGPCGGLAVWSSSQAACRCAFSGQAVFSQSVRP